jgi:hypothetical protein
MPDISLIDNKRPSKESVIENNCPTTPCTSTNNAPVAPVDSAVSKKSPTRSKVRAGPVAPRLMPTLLLTGSKCKS